MRKTIVDCIAWICPTNKYFNAAGCLIILHPMRQDILKVSFDLKTLVRSCIWYCHSFLSHSSSRSCAARGSIPFDGNMKKSVGLCLDASINLRWDAVEIPIQTLLSNIEQQSTTSFSGDRSKTTVMMPNGVSNGNLSKTIVAYLLLRTKSPECRERLRRQIGATFGGNQQRVISSYLPAL